MEPTPLQVAYQEGYKDGYNFTIAVIDRCIEKQTHLNPHVRRVVNLAYIALRDELRKSQGEITNAR